MTSTASSPIWEKQPRQSFNPWLSLVAEQSGDATQGLDHRRVDGVKRHLDPGVFGDRDDGFEELAVVLPELRLGVLAVDPVGELVGVLDLLDVERRRLGAAAHLDRFGSHRDDPAGVPLIAHDRNTRLAEVLDQGRDVRQGLLFALAAEHDVAVQRVGQRVDPRQAEAGGLDPLAGGLQLGDRGDRPRADSHRIRGNAVVEIVGFLLGVGVVDEHVRRAELSEIPESLLAEVPRPDAHSHVRTGCRFCHTSVSPGSV
jgi:hypothetical protein